jgi:4-aminobutyrate aminotransferase/(S)-3-amino-2-methylpropionate transaminase
LAKYAYEHGLITITAGTLSNVMRILVPLVVTDEQFDEGLDVLEAGLERVTEKRQPIASHA